MTNFAERLAWALASDGRTKEQVAGSIGLRLSDLGALVAYHNPVDPTVEQVAALGRAMPWLSLEWLVTGNGSRYGEPASIEKPVG
jgi:hypothetical protein